MQNKLKSFLAKLMKSPTNNVKDSDDLSGDVIIITGASKGIGKATAEVLYKSGASLVLVSRSMDELKQVFGKMDGLRVLIIEADITSEEQVFRLFKKTLEKFNRVDVLINNAGIFHSELLEDTSLNDFEKIVDTNIKGTFLMSRGVIPILKKQKEGFILNIGSKISHNTNVDPKKVLYATTKYAVEGFSFALNRELKAFGIRVSCLMPGTVNTFVSLRSSKFLSPYKLAEVILMMIKFKELDFESIVVKSKHQNI